MNFNPHTREGCDMAITAVVNRIPYFNPHTREGCDSYSTLFVLNRPYFNPHTREGCEDRESSVIPAPVAYFNPHTREGCDVVQEIKKQVAEISIHTPVKGVTQPRVSISWLMLFQSTHP